MNSKLFILVIAIILLIAPASAALTLSVDNRSQSFITWSWNEAAINASIDGWKIYYFDSGSLTFTLSDLDPDEEHTFRICSETECTSNTSSTLPDTSESTVLAGYFNTYLWAIFSLILIFVGLRYYGIFCLLSVAPSLIGLYNSLGPNLALDITFMPFWIYAILFIVGFTFYALRTAGFSGR